MREAGAFSIGERTEDIHNKASLSKISTILTKAGEGIHRSGFTKKGYFLSS